MTATQFYFPYFFDLSKFNKSLSVFGLICYLTMDDKTQMPKNLIISQKKFLDFSKKKTALLTIPFGATLMVQNDKLFYWTTDYDTIDLTQIQLKYLTSESVIANQKINLLQFSIGHNKFETNLDITDFITYTRKETLRYDQDYFEKFVLVFINKEDINIIPFDWFNKFGGDYGYVWPATARFDKERSKLHGQGMRMSDFAINIEDNLL